MKHSGRGRSITLRDKYYLKLRRELYRLQKVEQSAPLIEIEQPYQKGWVRFFVLRDDATRRKDADIIMKILKKINVRQYCPNGTFMQRCGKSKKLSPMKHHPEGFSRMHWLKLGWETDYGHYFDFRQVTHTNCYGYRDLVWSYVFKHPYLFKCHVEKYMVTHVRVDFPDVRSRMQEIEGYFETHKVSERLLNISGRSYHWKGGKPAVSEWKAINEQLNEHFEENNYEY